MINKVKLLFTKSVNKFKVEFNWGYLLSFVFFWSYSFYGSLTRFNSLYINIFSTLLLVFIFIFLLYLSFSKEQYLKDFIYFSFFDIILLSIVFLFFFSLSFFGLYKFLNGDQFYHSQLSIYHSIFILKAINLKTPRFNFIEAKYFLQIINILILVFFLLSILLIKALKNISLKILFTILVFLFFRLVILSSGGNSDVHPPFRLFPLWITSTIFGVNSFSFRLPQFFGLIALVFLSFKISSIYLKEKIGFLFAIFVGTIPVLWHTSLLVEQSIWGAIIFSYFLYNIICKILDDSFEFNFIRMFSILAIGVLLRQSIISCLILLVVLLIIEYKNKLIKSKKILHTSIPLLLVAPFLLNTLIYKNPALSVDNIQDSQLFKGGILYSIQSGIFAISLLNNLLYLPLFLPFLFFLQNKNKIYYFVILFFAVIVHLEFYSIRPVLWGIGRYQSELTVPFVIISALTMLIYFKRFKTSLLFFLIGGNIFIFFFYNNFNKPHSKLKYTYFSEIKKPFSHFIESQNIYPYDDALSAVKNNGYSNKFYLHGITYGVMPLILGGFNINDVFNQNLLYRKNYHLNDDSIFNSLNRNQNLKIILFSDLPDSLLIDKFKKNNWKPWKTFYYPENGSIINGIMR
jgi:hypothetical protein